MEVPIPQRKRVLTVGELEEAVKSGLKQKVVYAAVIAMVIYSALGGMKAGVGEENGTVVRSILVLGSLAIWMLMILAAFDLEQTRRSLGWKLVILYWGSFTAICFAVKFPSVLSSNRPLMTMAVMVIASMAQPALVFLVAGTAGDFVSRRSRAS